MGIMDYVKLNKHMYGFSIDQIKEYQRSEIVKLVEFAIENTDYYKQQFKNSKMENLDDFYKLPTMDKQILMDNFDGINTCGLKLNEVSEYAVAKELSKDYLGYYKGEYVIGLSSGTSGNKGIFITPKSMTKRLPFVFLARSGIPLKFLPFRILFLLRVFSQGFEDINFPLIKLKYLGTMTPMDEIIQELNEGKINILMGPPSLIRHLLPNISKIKTQIKMIASYAEVLEEEEKERFSKAFNTSVIEIYQASEGQIGSTCRCGNLHVNEDLVFVELYDNNGMPVEKPNIVATKMLVTNLVNRAQPIIRYEMNDLLMLGEPCPCGSNFRVIKKVIGRHDDVFYFKNEDGQRQHIFPDLMSRWIITTSDNIREFKAIQNPDSSMRIVIDLFDKSEAAKGSLIKDITKRLEEELLRFKVKTEVEIEFRFISIEENIGKYKRFIRL